MRGLRTVGLAVLGLGIVAGSTALSWGHEIKVLASRLVTAPGQRDTVYISWGHILPVDAPIDAESIDRYELRSPSGSVEYLDTDGYSMHANEIQVEEEGLYTAVATRKPSVYTVVVDENGTHQHRSATKAEAEAEAIGGVRIEYSARSHQSAKALLQSGTVQAADLEVLGHELEIIALDEPEQWRAGRGLKFQVLFLGEPATRQDVFARYIGFKPDNAWCYAAPTEHDGTVTVHVDRPGTWIIRAQRTLPASEADRDQFDVESYTATLALEVLP